MRNERGDGLEKQQYLSRVTNELVGVSIPVSMLERTALALEQSGVLRRLPSRQPLFANDGRPILLDFLYPRGSVPLLSSGTLPRRSVDAQLAPRNPPAPSWKRTHTTINTPKSTNLDRHRPAAVFEGEGLPLEQIKSLETIKIHLEQQGQRRDPENVWRLYSAIKPLPQASRDEIFQYLRDQVREPLPGQRRGNGGRGGEGLPMVLGRFKPHLLEDGGTAELSISKLRAIIQTSLRLNDWDLACHLLKQLREKDLGAALTRAVLREYMFWAFHFDRFDQFHYACHLWCSDTAHDEFMPHAGFLGALARQRKNQVPERILSFWTQILKQRNGTNSEAAIMLERFLDQGARVALMAEETSGSQAEALLKKLQEQKTTEEYLSKTTESGRKWYILPIFRWYQKRWPRTMKPEMLGRVFNQLLPWAGTGALLELHRSFCIMYYKNKITSMSPQEWWDECAVQAAVRDFKTAGYVRHTEFILEFQAHGDHEMAKHAAKSLPRQLKLSTKQVDALTSLKEICLGKDYAASMEKMDELGGVVRPNATVLGMAMSRAVEAGDLDTTLQLFGRAKTLGLEQSPGVVAQVITGLGKADFMREAHQTYEWALRGDGAGVEVGNRMLHLYVDKFQLKEAYQVMQDMAERGIQWDGTTYALVMKGLARVGALKRVYGILRGAVAGGVFIPSSTHFDVVMTSALKHNEYDLVHRIALLMRQHMIPMTLGTMALLAKATHRWKAAAAAKGGPDEPRKEAQHKHEREEQEEEDEDEELDIQICTKRETLEPKASISNSWKRTDLDALFDYKDMMTQFERRTRSATQLPRHSNRALEVLLEVGDQKMIQEQYLPVFNTLHIKEPSLQQAPSFMEIKYRLGDLDGVMALWDEYLALVKQRELVKVEEAADGRPSILQTRFSRRGNRKSVVVRPGAEAKIDGAFSVARKTLVRQNRIRELLALVRELTETGFQLGRSNWNLLIQVLAKSGNLRDAFRFCENNLMSGFHGWKHMRMYVHYKKRVNTKYWRELRAMWQAEAGAFGARETDFRNSMGRISPPLETFMPVKTRGEAPLPKVGQEDLDVAASMHQGPMVKHVKDLRGENLLSEAWIEQYAKDQRVARDFLRLQFYRRRRTRWQKIRQIQGESISLSRQFAYPSRHPGFLRPYPETLMILGRIFSDIVKTRMWSEDASQLYRFIEDECPRTVKAIRQLRHHYNPKIQRWFSDDVVQYTDMWWYNPAAPFGRIHEQLPALRRFHLYRRARAAMMAGELGLEKESEEQTQWRISHKFSQYLQDELHVFRRLRATGGEIPTQEDGETLDLGPLVGELRRQRFLEWKEKRGRRSWRGVGIGASDGRGENKGHDLADGREFGKWTKDRRVSHDERREQDEGEEEEEEGDDEGDGDGDGDKDGQDDEHAIYKRRRARLEKMMRSEKRRRG